MMRNGVTVLEIKEHLIRSRNLNALYLLRKDALIKFINTENGCTGLLEHCFRDIFIPAVRISAFSACSANPNGVVGIRVFAPLAI